MEAKNITKPDEKATANQPIQQAKSNEQPNTSAELTGNATEGQKDTNETRKQPQRQVRQLLLSMLADLFGRILRRSCGQKLAMVQVSSHRDSTLLRSMRNVKILSLWLAMVK